jgi:uncharacterized cupredoxin-like copper-binding protein
MSALAVVAIALTAACSSDSGTDAIRITATDTTCVPTASHFGAGKTTFEVKNDGSKVTEVYVYGEGDTVVGEVENIGPGTTRKMTVDLKAGAYELACKPGQTGSGIRAHIEAEGAGGEQSGAALTPDRSVTVKTIDYSFDLPDPQIKVGEKIKFELMNQGKATHEFEVFGPDDKVVGEVEGIAAGGTGSATLEFAKAGTYRYECHLEDHFERGMKGTLTVS